MILVEETTSIGYFEYNQFDEINYFQRNRSVKKNPVQLESCEYTNLYS